MFMSFTNFVSIEGHGSFYLPFVNPFTISIFLSSFLQMFESLIDWIFLILVFCDVSSADFIPLPFYKGIAHLKFSLNYTFFSMSYEIIPHVRILEYHLYILYHYLVLFTEYFRIFTVIYIIRLIVHIHARLACHEYSFA